MRRLAHISDLHFGTVVPELADALLRDIEEFEPHVVAVTGDITQRAKAWQFELAVEFFSKLRCPYLVVPGNHDITPLYNPLGRLLDPYAAYRRHVSQDLEGVFADDELLVIGLNTVAPFRWKEGTVSCGQLDWITRQAARRPASFRVLAAHHPLAATVQGHAPKTIRRHRSLLDTLEAADVALCLTGHLHQSHSGSFASAPGQAHRTLVVRASTATSSRVRGHRNAYNRLVIEPSGVELTVRSYDGNGFERERVERFERRAGGWAQSDVEIFSRGSVDAREPSLRRSA